MERPNVSRLESRRPEQNGTSQDKLKPQEPLNVEETDRERIQRLGRQRPAQFKTIWAEAAFCYSIIASQLMAVSSIRLQLFR
jgi:hypothetical protein